MLAVTSTLMLSAMRNHQRGSGIALSLAALLWLTAADAGTGVGRAGRWFTYNDKPVYLVGFDLQQLAADPSIDIVATLDKLADHGINKVRVWVDCWFLGARGLSPWRKIDGRFDLDAWDEEHYWPRMRTLAAQARARGIVVEVTIFASYPNAPGYWWDKPAGGNAWNGDFNRNATFSANAKGHFYPEFYSLDHSEQSSSGKTLLKYQEALVHKTVAELGSYDNVYFEVANEFAVETQGAPAGAIHDPVLRRWQETWARRINSRTSQLVAVHGDADGRGTGMKYWVGNDAVDVVNLRFNNATPDEIAARLRQQGGQRSDKILTINETRADPDIYKDIDLHTRYAWAMFLAGGHVAFYEDNPRRVLEDPRWSEAAKRLRVLRQIAESVRFWEMAPVDAMGKDSKGVVVRGPSGDNVQLMAKPGSGYVAYFWGPRSSTDVVMRLPSGRYSYTWHNVTDGAVLGRGSVRGGQPRIAAPKTWNEQAGVVMVIRRG